MGLLRQAERQRLTDAYAQRERKKERERERERERRDLDARSFLLTPPISSTSPNSLVSGHPILLAAWKEKRKGGRNTRTKRGGDRV